MTIFHQKNIKLILILEFHVKKSFEDEVKKYCYMWKEGGQFSTENIIMIN